MNQYVGKVLLVTRRKDGDVEKYICIAFDVVSRRYTLVPTFGRLCRQHLVTLGQGGWTVVDSLDDQAQIKKTIADLELFIRTLNADPFNLPSEGSVAQKNLSELKKLVKADSANDKLDAFKAMAELAAFTHYLKAMTTRRGKLVFVEMPMDDEDANMGGEYIVLEESRDSLYCISTVDCDEALDLARIRIHSNKIGDKTATVLRTYSDEAYINRFIGKLKEFAEKSQGTQRDRADNMAAQLERMMTQLYPKTANKPFAATPDNHHAFIFAAKEEARTAEYRETFAPKRGPLFDLAFGSAGNPFGPSPKKALDPLEPCNEEGCCGPAKSARTSSPLYSGLL